MISDKFKLFLFKQLYKELSNVEIIPYKDSIYFIDRDKKYWYFEYEKNGTLWWRYDFFTNFFLIFSLELDDYQKVMGEWVEEVLNCRVSTTGRCRRCRKRQVEEVLNCRVSTTFRSYSIKDFWVEEVLNCRVSSTSAAIPSNEEMIEQVLNHKVTSINFGGELMYPLVGEILSYKVTSTEKVHGILPPFVDEVLNENT